MLLSDRIFSDHWESTEAAHCPQTVLNYLILLPEMCNYNFAMWCDRLWLPVYGNTHCNQFLFAIRPVSFFYLPLNGTYTIFWRIKCWHKLMPTLGSCPLETFCLSSQRCYSVVMVFVSLLCQNITYFEFAAYLLIKCFCRFWRWWTDGVQCCYNISLAS